MVDLLPEKSILQLRIKFSNFIPANFVADEAAEIFELTRCGPSTFGRHSGRRGDAHEEGDGVRCQQQ